MKKIFLKLLQTLRILFYSLISSRFINEAKIFQPLLVEGNGVVIIKKKVTIGVPPAPGFYSGYSFINARNANAYIEIGENTRINNNFCIISNGAKIIIGKDCLFGFNTIIIDSDFHDLDKNSRFGGKNVINADVIIEDNVFIGNNVQILKGVTIGKNSIIGSGSVVVKNIESDCIAAGNPCKIIKKLE